MKRAERRLLAYGTPARRYLGLTVIASILSVVAVVAQAVLMAGVISAIFLGAASLGDVRGALVALGIVVVARAALPYVTQFSAAETSVRVKADVRRDIVAKVAALGPVAVSRERAGELAVTIGSGLDALDPYFARYLPQLPLAVLAPGLIIGYAATRDWLAALILAITLPLLVVFMVLVGVGAQRASRTRWQVLRRLSGHFFDVLSGLVTLRIFGRAHRQVVVVGDVTDAYRRTTMQVLRIAFLNTFVLELAATLGTALVAVAVGLRVVSGNLDLEPALCVLILAPEVYLPLRRLGSEFHAANEARVVAERVFEIIDLPTTVNPTTVNTGLTAGWPTDSDTNANQHAEADCGRAPASVATASSGTIARLETADLSGVPQAQTIAGVPVDAEALVFTYQGRTGRALEGCDLTVAGGERVGICGENGSGKSTLALVVGGLARPDSGQVRVDGIDPGLATPDWRRNHIAWLPQCPHLFRATLRDNTRLICPDAADARIWRALDAAQCDFARDLPDGLDTVLGDGGRPLSAGERQRIAIARIHLSSAALIILDEATAALDKAREAAVVAALDSLIASRSALVISHRRAPLEICDRVIQMTGGRLLHSPVGERRRERVLDSGAAEC